jgi:hypothetical protein
MEDSVRDNRLRKAAFARVRAPCESHEHLTAQQLGEGFYVDGLRYPMINPRRGIFNPPDFGHGTVLEQIVARTVNSVGINFPSAISLQRA